MEKPILLLGDPQLYLQSTPITQAEWPALAPVVQHLHDTLLAYRQRMGAGRAIAAPQIGVSRRLVYLFTDLPRVFINPVLRPRGEEMVEVLDDCMSFPHLLVRVRRYRRCAVHYYDEHWQPQTLDLQDDMAELLQHECDHLDGVLATMRAIDERAFVMRPH